jgi:chloride channel 3/4/5
MWQSFVCAMAAAVVLQAFDPFRSGKLVLYQTKYSVDWHGFEIVPYAILGILGVSDLVMSAPSLEHQADAK